ncbi:heme exporter protein CcmD [Camelimonas lactis]|uniref:Heme exporter protein D n=1 Tax=Camelimonas lactis TaxID=659006 RepID=A0A4R2GVD7_9HYPH|nr:heme exporter protein CcmD [Camelimonas lactis]TCO14615.1 heme exporter protein CcmD [Camelimonas lactis]
MTGTYAGYVLAAYAVAFVLMAGLTLWTVLGARQAKRELARTEAESALFSARRTGAAAPGRRTQS